MSGPTYPDYKTVTQGWWALGAVLGSFSGAQIARWLGRRSAYFLFSLGATALTDVMFLAGAIFTALGGSYPKVGAICGLAYALGMIVIWWAPDTTGKSLKG